MANTQSVQLNQILVAPRAYLRMAAFVLSALAVMLPAVSMSAFGADVSVNVLGLGGWIIIFPILALVALLSPAVAPLASYTALLDIVSAVIGVVASLFVLFNMNTPFGPIGGEMGAGLGIGAYALFVAAALAVLAALPAGFVGRLRR